MATLQIPGYHFDGKRYYKVIPGHPAPAAPAGPTESAGRKRKKQRRERETGKAREAGWGGTVGLLRGARDSGLSGRHTLDAMALGRAEPTRRLSPDCLPMDEGIDRIAFDDRDPNVLRVGGSSGSIATGTLERVADGSAYYPNDEEGWRTAWMFPSRITSLHTCGDRILATCLGAPAQALIGTTSDNISLASVTLSPRKTSLWTSALSPTVVALGCDRKVLISRDPTKPSMDGYVTGGRHGDGAVFALDLTENLIFAGTRKGEVKIFDQRSSPTSDETISRPEVDLKVSSSVTNVRRIENGVLVASMDGSLAVYDLRFFTPKPILRLLGHQNSYSWDLGLDVWRDEFVAAGGHDKRVRIWSLRTGLAVPTPHLPLSSAAPPSSLAARTFADPIKALRFSEPPPLRRDDGLALPRLAVPSPQRTGPAIWIGDGDQLVCFAP